jgi:hypothetical protein
MQQSIRARKLKTASILSGVMIAEAERSAPSSQRFSGGNGNHRS